MPEISWTAASVIHNLEHALQVLTAIPSGTTEVILRTPENALSVTGSRYWLALLVAVQQEFSSLNIHLIVDAAESAGLAQGAIADGHRAIHFSGNAETKDKLTQIAAASGSVLV